MLMKIFGPKRDEATGKWRRLQNEQLYDLYSSPDIIRVIQSRRVTLPGYVARAGYGRDAYRIWIGGPEGRRSLATHRRR
jgi:hypothetical protein